MQLPLKKAAHDRPSEHVDVDDLARLIETLQGVIRHHTKAIGSYEYRTRMLLVVPLLNALGWDTTNPAMVIPTTE